MREASDGRKYGDIGAGGKGDAVLQVCVGHEHMIGLSNEFWERCSFHGVDSTNDDATLEIPVEPVAFLPHGCDEWVIGGRNELIALRDDIDRALELLP